MEPVGILTNSSLMLFQIADNQSRVNILKRAAIMFENILLPTPNGLGDMDRNTYISIIGNPNVNNIDKGTKEKKYHDIFLDYKDIFNNRQVIETYLDEIGEDDLWGYKHSDKYIKLIEKLLSDTNKKMSQSEVYENMKFILPALSDDIKAFKFILEQKSGLVPIITEWHSRSIIDILENKAIQDPDKVIRILTERVIPDFAQLSWNDILELRKDKLIKLFRNKMNELSASATSNQPPSSIINSVSKSIEQDLWGLVDRSTPNMITTTIGGIISNIPLPIPVNPASVGLAGKDIWSKYHLRKDYGWLMFVNKARKITQKKPRT